MTIDIKRFQELKTKSVASLIRAGDDYAVSYKQFDPQTGEVLPSKVFGVDMKEIDEKIISLQAEIGELKAFKADCLALK